MIAICWAIFAFLFTCFFIYLWIRGIGYVNKRWGTGSAIVFAIVVMSMASENYRTDSTLGKPKSYVTQPNAKVTGLNSKMLVLEKNPLYKITLNYTYGFDNQLGKMVPVISYSNITGIMSGTRWSPFEVLIIPDSSGTQLHYLVAGTLERHLLNLFHHYQDKTYEGTIDVSGSFPGKKIASE